SGSSSEASPSPCSLSRSSASISRRHGMFVERCERLLECFEGEGELVTRDLQGRSDRDGVGHEIEEQDAVLLAFLRNEAARQKRRSAVHRWSQPPVGRDPLFPRRRVLAELDRPRKPSTRDPESRWVTLDQLLESVSELLADLGDVLNDVLVQHDLDVGGDAGDGGGTGAERRQ